MPEHVETRSLYNPTNPEMEYGKIEMWIDLFPLNANVKPPPPVNIAIRKPQKYQLRIIVKNVSNVSLDDYNRLTGERSSDIYVRSYVASENLCDAQKTDVHYRSISGEGNFNWRFVFNFDYLSAEKRVVYTQRTGLFSFQTDVIKKEPLCKLNLKHHLWTLFRKFFVLYIIWTIKHHMNFSAIN